MSTITIKATRTDSRREKAALFPLSGRRSTNTTTPFPIPSNLLHATPLYDSHQCRLPYPAQQQPRQYQPQQRQRQQSEPQRPQQQRPQPKALPNHPPPGPHTPNFPIDTLLTATSHTSVAVELFTETANRQADSLAMACRSDLNTSRLCLTPSHLQHVRAPSCLSQVACRPIPRTDISSETGAASPDGNSTSRPPTPPPKEPEQLSENVTSGQEQAESATQRGGSATTPAAEEADWWNANGMAPFARQNHAEDHGPTPRLPCPAMHVVIIQELEADLLEFNARMQALGAENHRLKDQLDTAFFHSFHQELQSAGKEVEYAGA